MLLRKPLFYGMSKTVCRYCKCLHSTTTTNGSWLLLQRLYEGILQGDRACLAKGITLVESLSSSKRLQGQELLSRLMVKRRQEELEDRRHTFRIGLSGAPGAGKSSLIETLGKRITAEGYKLAVLAVDPSSISSGGSILGDKTRMFDLANNPNAYIRPSPNKGTLGGVTRTTNESIVLCEAAGFDTIIVETVGVGQSEISVSDMVDMFCVIVPPASGDELQGLKRGIIEVADCVIINKADGDLVPAARRAQSEYTSALKLMRQRYDFWRPQVLPVSAKTGSGIERLWNHMNTYHETLIEKNQLIAKRDNQKLKWMWNHVQDYLMSSFKSHPRVVTQLADLERQVMQGHLSPGYASDLLVEDFFSNSGIEHRTA